MQPSLSGGSSSLRICLLGGFQLRRGRNPVVVPLPAQRLLAFLGLQDRPVHRRRVAGTLWPDVDERRATANLRSALWRLRTHVNVVVDDRSSGLHLADAVWVDAREVCAAARALFAGDDPMVAPADFDLDLLPDWYDDWVLVERERLRQISVHALESLVPRLVAKGDFLGAVETGLRAVRVEPLRETAQRALISAHLAEGNPAEALRQFRRYAAMLKAELGLMPSTELMSQLIAAIGPVVSIA